MTERRITIHDQLLVVFEKAVLVVGQFKGKRFHPRFVLIGGAACEVDAARSQLHDKEQIESGQSTLGPDFNCGAVDRSHHVPVRLQKRLL